MRPISICFAAAVNSKIKSDKVIANEDDAITGPQKYGIEMIRR